MTDKRYFYLYDKRNHPVACVAVNKNDCVTFAVSTHNPRDKFNRSIARAVADGRLSAGKFHGNFKYDPPMFVRGTILALITANRNLPHRTRLAAEWQLSKIRKEMECTARGTAAALQGLAAQREEEEGSKCFLLSPNIF